MVAWAFAELRQGELPAASVAVTTVARSAITLAGGGPGALAVRPFSGLFAAGYAYVADPDRDLLLDQAAASLTRYPPGLLSALDRIAQIGTTVARARPESAHLWMADPGVAVPGMPPGPRSSSASRPCASSERQVSPTTPDLASSAGHPHP